MILKDKILDRISEGEDIVILVNGYNFLLNTLQTSKFAFSAS